MTHPGKIAPILVFLGPTLQRAEAEAALDAIYLNPVAQGDIILVAHAFHPRAMVLIDGQFEDRPPVRHKEILWAMAQGIVMIGAASMGALRAAELEAFGMTGVGLIHRWYRRWPLAADDAVAVQSAPAELGFMPLTDALVDLERSFSSIMRRGLVTRLERDSLSATARSMNFRDRSFEAVLRISGFAPERMAMLKQGLVKQKRHDALLALKLAPHIASRPIKPRINMPWTATNTFLRDLQASSINLNLLDTFKADV